MGYLKIPPYKDLLLKFLNIHEVMGKTRAFHPYFEISVMVTIPTVIPRRKSLACLKHGDVLCFRGGGISSQG
jgi:hypothetical protein